ncbi:hypothetical protein DQQ10_02165 [Pseudochryseolinea flava]|uniref:Uncharacterized protein n=2 Tax=Pseudochryseolinea flava TaxID=2059302 RepID=A0A364Y9P3_9BACT|nr:hypothetical protein DQQ10_02165 [Pseudochryseolinea flava]
MLTLASALSDLVGGIYFSQGRSTVVLFNSFYVVQFFLLTWFYFELAKTKKSRTTVLGGLFIYAVAFVLVSVYLQSFLEYQTFLWTISGMIMILFSSSYVVYLFSAGTVMQNHASFWINSGILYYFSFNLFLFVMSSYVLTKLEPQIGMLIWSFHNANNVVKNILLGLGISSSAAATMVK